MRGPITIDARIPAFAANVQMLQPLAASSEYTIPFWLPTNRRPPAIVGCAHADAVSGNPSAHLRWSLGTCEAVSPACSADRKCVFSGDAPQPFQAGAAARSASGAVLAHMPRAVP